MMTSRLYFRFSHALDAGAYRIYFDCRLSMAMPQDSPASHYIISDEAERHDFHERLG